MYSTSTVLITACVCEKERERWSHHSGVYSPSEIVLIAVCGQTHTSFITVSVMRLCSPLGLELMVKLTTLLTVFTLILKAGLAIMERGVTFPTRLVVFGQSQCTVPAGQSEQTVLVRRTDFVENEAFERGGA